MSTTDSAGVSEIGAAAGAESEAGPAAAAPPDLEVVGLEHEEEAASSDAAVAAAPTSVTSPKKWYLKTEEIYAVVKHAAADVRVGDVALSERAIEVVDGFALAISKNVLRINETEGLSIVKKMDEFTTSLLSAFDQSMDVYSVKFAESVEKLSEVVMKQTEWMSEKMKLRAIEAQMHMQAVSDKMSQGVNTAYNASEPYVKNAIEASEPYVKTGVETTKKAVGTVDDYLKTWLNRIGQDYPDAAARVKQIIVTPHPSSALLALATAERRGEILHSVSTAVNTQVSSAYGVVQSVLGSCQPYVAGAVGAASPYVSKAVDAASPYVSKAVGAAEPVIYSPYVTGPTKQILEFSVVKNTIAGTQSAVNAVKSYCTTSKEDNEDASNAIPAVTNNSNNAAAAGEAAPSSSSSAAAAAEEAAPSSSSSAAAAGVAEPSSSSPSAEPEPEAVVDAAAVVVPMGTAADLPPAPPASEDVPTSAGAENTRESDVAEEEDVATPEGNMEAEEDATPSLSATGGNTGGGGGKKKNKKNKKKH